MANNGTNNALFNIFIYYFLQNLKKSLKIRRKKNVAFKQMNHRKQQFQNVFF